MKRYVLDANALIALLRDEEGADKVMPPTEAKQKFSPWHKLVFSMARC